MLLYDSTRQRESFLSGIFTFPPNFVTSQTEPMYAVTTGKNALFPLVKYKQVRFDSFLCNIYGQIKLWNSSFQ